MSSRFSWGRFRWGRLVPLVLASIVALAPIAEARIGGGSSFGSRGSRTFSAPPSTSTSPFGSSTIGRSMTQPGSNYGRPPGSGFGSQPAFGGGMGFGRGLLGGLVGAGLIGLLFGHGMGGGGGFGFLGGLIQIAILFFLARAAFRWFTRSRAGFAGGSGPSMSGFGGAGPSPGGFGGPGSSPGGFGQGGFGMGGGPAYDAGPGSGPGMGGPSQPLSLNGEDFNAFERVLQNTQLAFGSEDLDRLRGMSTPEMASYFAEEVANNARRGVVNKIADVKLLKGDLAEAWSEPAGEYATVAMRFSLLDWTVERDSGALVSGNVNTPDQAAEVWTFRRDHGTGPAGWRVSAIQQAATS